MSGKPCKKNLNFFQFIPLAQLHLKTRDWSGPKSILEMSSVPESQHLSQFLTALMRSKHSIHVTRNKPSLFSRREPNISCAAGRSFTNHQLRTSLPWLLPSSRGPPRLTATGTCDWMCGWCSICSQCRNNHGRGRHGSGPQHPPGKTDLSGSAYAGSIIKENKNKKAYSWYTNSLHPFSAWVP